MMFKVIHNDMIVDVLDKVKFVRYLPNAHRAVLSNKSCAHGFYGSNNKTIYGIEGQIPQCCDWKVGKLVPITETEYKELFDKLLNNVLIQANLAKLKQAKEAKIAEVSRSCSQSIVAGVQVMLSDNVVHKFQATVEDQMNLVAIEQSIRNGASKVLYHETDQLCRYYSAEDMLTIIQAIQKHKEYHLAYFNCLKHCINKLNNEAEVDAVYYGIDLCKLDAPAELLTLLKEVTNG